MISRLSGTLLLTLATSASPALAQCPDSLSLARLKTCATAAGDYVLVAGGDDSAGFYYDTVDLYSLSSDSWSTAALTVPRNAASAASVGGKALIAGGGKLTAGFGSYFAFDIVDIFDATTGAWTTANLSTGRMFMASTQLGSRAFFAGGISSSAPPFSVRTIVDIYDDAAGTWSVAQLSHPRYSHSAASAGTVALFAGGHDGLTPVDNVDLYNTITGQWSTAQLSEARMQMGATSLGSRVYFAGGAAWDGTQWSLSDVVDVYDTATGLWSIEYLSVPRSRLAAATVAGLALFAGGHDGVGESDVVDAFDGTRWFTFRLSEARSDLVAASAGSAALFLGGESLTTPLATTGTAVDRFPSGIPIPYCFGDGTGAACPCANTGAPGHGCANSGGPGARLEGSGCPSISGDSLQLLSTGLTPNQPVLLFAGVNAVQLGLGASFGDGLRCAGGAVVRVAIKTADSNGTTSWGPGLTSTANWLPGDVRRLQAWYRDPGGPCGSAFNLSNGLEVGFEL